MRVVAVILEVAASGLTKIPISDQVGFLSSRFTAQSRPRKPIVPKNRAGRERINLRRQNRLASTIIVNGCRLIAPCLREVGEARIGVDAGAAEFLVLSTPLRAESSLVAVISRVIGRA
jgi:hypothetical protein